MKPDFIVRYDPKTETQEELTRKIFYNLFARPLKFNMPKVLGIFGKSGQGKSCAALKLVEILAPVLNFDLMTVLEDINVHTPFEYAEKLDRVLYHKKHFNKDKKKFWDYKRNRFFIVHEARTIVNSRDWQNFATRAVGHVNAMSRSVKRMCFVLVSQDVKDITKEIRKQLDYYIKVYRPLGHPARLYIRKIYVDDTDIENPKIRTTKVKGVLVSPKGKYRAFYPEYFELGLPSKDVLNVFDKKDTEAKVAILSNILEKMVMEMKKQIPDVNEKVDSMVEWYTKDPSRLRAIGRMTTRGNWKIDETVKKAHELTKTEFDLFKRKLTEKFEHDAK